MSKEPIELRVGEIGESFAKRNSTIATIDRQPAGLNFYELNWPTKAMGKVVVANSTFSFQIQNVLSVMGTENMDFPNEGISEVHINFALSNSETIEHDDARRKTFAFLQMISQKGWKFVIPRSMARIRGKDMNDYLLSTQKHTTLDPSYIPSLDEWMRYDDLTTWAFYADRVFLEVQITREHTLIDPSKPGAYLLSINLQSEEEHFRSYVDGLSRSQWKELLMSSITQMAQRRAEMESNLRSRQIAIDETYTDPPLPNLSKK